MDYLELGDAATQAFKELGDNLDFPHVLPRPCLSTRTTAQLLPHLRRRRVEATYLLRLETPLSTPRDLASALNLTRVPRLESGTAENGEASFCRLSQSNINAFDSWTEKHHPTRKSTKIRISLAHKDAGELPVLGRDATLPHHRSRLSVGVAERRAPEFPVWYFFYGTLADTERLARLFGVGVGEILVLRPAVLLDGRVRVWAGRYKAVVDEPGGAVDDFAYACASVDQEDAIRVYEGDAYEVVAARMVLEGKEIVGRTFRFAGCEGELSG